MTHLSCTPTPCIFSLLSFIGNDERIDDYDGDGTAGGNGPCKAAPPKVQGEARQISAQRPPSRFWARAGCRPQVIFGEPLTKHFQIKKIKCIFSR